MSDFAIQVEGLGKKYRIGTHAPYHRFTELLTGIAKTPFTLIKNHLNDLKTQKDVSQEASEKGEFWALKNVNFEIKQGEIVGVIGRNGAGKSTLLKLLSRITQPTTGRIRYRGRIGSLLEVGTGFHPELTGRDNIYLNGAILGMTRAEVRNKFDEIVAFSEIGQFLDTAVKHYSSGMYMRLAFAVAAHLESQILLIDEILAVGDAEFQKKCLGKMGQVAKSGKTILFVSHNIGSIHSLCTNALFLVNGQLHNFGSTRDVIAQYQLTNTLNGDGIWTNPQQDVASDEARFQSIRILDSQNIARNHFNNNEEIIIECTVKVRKSHKLLKVGYDLFRDSSLVFRSLHIDDPQAMHFLPEGIHTLRCHIPPNQLNIGFYELSPHLSLHCIRSMTLPQESVLRLGINLHITTPFHQVLTPQNHPAMLFPILSWRN